MPQTREHILLALQVGVPCDPWCPDKCGHVEDAEVLEGLVELDVRELLKSYINFPRTTICRGARFGAASVDGDALMGKEKSMKLMAAVDANFHLPVRPPM